MVAKSGNPIALRIDDVGASSKQYEVYSYWRLRLGPITLRGNWLFLKYLPPFRRWGVYREMTANEWERVLAILRRHNARLTVAITACWVKDENEQIPFPRMFPRQAEVINAGVREGLLEIANHGLTHCVSVGNAFKTRWFSGNRNQHREFWDWLPRQHHEEHIRRSQEILQDYFGPAIVTLVPPGNVFSSATLDAAMVHGLRYVSCATEPRVYSGIEVLGEENTVAFHDRDLVLNGMGYLEELLERYASHSFQFVRELPLAHSDRSSTSPFPIVQEKASK